MGIKTYRDLDIWKKGIELVKDTYKSTEKFPKQEMYGLVVQMRRSAISIPSNVAEGFRRYHNKEYKQFLYVSLGSCARTGNADNNSKRAEVYGAERRSCID